MIALGPNLSPPGTESTAGPVLPFTTCTQTPLPEKTVPLYNYRSDGLPLVDFKIAQLTPILARGKKKSLLFGSQIIQRHLCGVHPACQGVASVSHSFAGSKL